MTQLTFSFQVFFFLSVIFALLESTASAQAFGPDPEPGWHTSAGVGIGQIEREAKTQKTLQSYDDPPESDERRLPIPYIKIARFDQDRRSSWSISLEKMSIILERKQHIGIGRFSLAYGHSFSIFGLDSNSKTYENPYLLNEKRESTRLNTISKRVRYSIGRGLGINLGYQLDDIWYDTDQTPDLHDDLGRDGTRSKATLGVNLFFVRLGVESMSFDAAGEADSSDGTNQNLMIVFPVFKKKIILMTRIQQDTSKFRAEHPIFNTTREDKAKMLMVQLLLKLEGYSLGLMSMSRERDSNIDFFDESMQLTSLNIKFLF